MHLRRSPLRPQLSKRAHPAPAALLCVAVGMVVAGIVGAALTIDVPLQAADSGVRAVDLSREALQTSLIARHPRDIR